ncbi:MAG: TraR/DksA family transcriptional regulator [Nitrospinota bacterium]
MRATKKRKFREKLLVIRQEILGDVEVSKQRSQEMGDDGTQDIADMAANTYSRQMIMDLGEKERERLRLVDKALQKLDNGDYGICEECGHPIPEKRLEIMPYARFCVGCLAQIEKRDRTG